MSFACYSSPLEIIKDTAALGQRGRVQEIAFSEDQAEHIASLLRRGLTQGWGLVQWSLRSLPGYKFDQAELDEIANLVSECFSSGTNWRLEIRI